LYSTVEASAVWKVISALFSEASLSAFSLPDVLKSNAETFHPSVAA
jgi:hypothetical protein